jgi:hypothetical protein
MNRPLCCVLCLGALILATAGCSQSKRKDYIPTQIQEPPADPPILVGGPPPAENPERNAKPAVPVPKEKPKAVPQ